MLLLACAFSIPLLSSCINSKIQKQLEIHEQTQTLANSTLIDASFTKSTGSLNWEAALDLALQQNTHYNNAIYSLSEAKLRRKQQWQELIPNFHILASIDQNVSSISDVTVDDINLNLVSNIRIPNPIRYYAQAYTYALTEIQSKYNLELQRRQLHANLFQIFQQADNLKEQTKLLTEEIKKASFTPDQQLVNHLRSLKKRKKRLSIAEERFRVQLNRFFNSPGKHWAIVGSPPSISYKNKLNRLRFKSGYGALGTKLQAIQIEGSIIQAKNAKSQRLPSIDLGVNAPNLYDSAGEQSFSFDGADYNMFSSLSKSIKPYDILDKKILTDSQRRAQATRDTLMLQVESETSQLAINKKTYNSLLLEQSQLRATIGKLMDSRYEGSTQLSSYREGSQQLENINYQLTQLDLQFWIWDEDYWKNN